jgi:serine/threonine-protein kinase
VIQVGSKIGAYEVVKELGRGGMATLYLGTYRGPGGFARRVAIKVLHRDVARDPELVRMFLDEARLSACIQHPNVVHVEAFEQLGDLHYLVMEYIEGCTLAQVLRDRAQRREPLPAELAVAILAQVAAGLHAAHEAADELGQPLNIIHRDVSPQNVLLGVAGHVKLIDFGVAKAQHRLAASVSGEIKGKLAYMAPEQLAGEALDRRVDVWALGVVLWEALTSTRLFLGPNEMSTILAVRQQGVLPPSTLRPDLPPKIDDVILAMLARPVFERFATTAAARAAMLTSVPAALAVDGAAIGQLARATMQAPPPANAAQAQALPADGPATVVSRPRRA